MSAVKTPITNLQAISQALQSPPKSPKIPPNPPKSPTKAPKCSQMPINK